MVVLVVPGPQTRNLRTRSERVLLGYAVSYRAATSVYITNMLAEPAFTELLLSKFTRLSRQLQADAIRMSCFGPREFPSVNCGLARWT